jgi:hypothetical protein
LSVRTACWSVSIYLPEVGPLGPHRDAYLESEQVFDSGVVAVVDRNPLEPLGVPPAELHALLVRERDVGGDDDDAVVVAPAFVPYPHHTGCRFVGFRRDPHRRTGVLDPPRLDLLLQQAARAHVGRRYEHSVVADQFGQRDLVAGVVATHHRLKLRMVEGRRLEVRLGHPRSDDELVGVASQQTHGEPPERRLAAFLLGQIVDAQLVAARWLRLDQVVLGQRHEMRVVRHAGQDRKLLGHHLAAHHLVLRHHAAGRLEEPLPPVGGVEPAVGIAMEQRFPGPGVELLEDLLDGRAAVSAAAQFTEPFRGGVVSVGLRHLDEDA